MYFDCVFPPAGQQRERVCATLVAGGESGGPSPEERDAASRADLSREELGSI